MSDRDGEDKISAEDRIRALPCFPLIERFVSFLRIISPRHASAAHIAIAITCQKRQVYGLVQIARKYLRLTTGESIPNIRGVGYRISREARAVLFESIKSGNRADGNLGSEIREFYRLTRDQLKTPEDIELYIAQQAKVRFGEARLAISRDMRPVLTRLEKNLALVDVADRDTLTPWQELGLDDPNGDKN